MTDDNLLPFCFPAVRRKKTTACSISGDVRFFRIDFLRLISCNASSPPLSYSSLKR
jgi:hypothetical protein